MRVITQAEFERAKKIVDTAIKKYGSVRNALLCDNDLEALALVTAIEVTCNWYRQTHQEKAIKNKDSKVL